jgi:hypothetical protein
MIVAFDFDGTVVEDEYPRIGAVKPFVMEYLKRKQEEGAELILWTCRVEGALQLAVEWCIDQGLKLAAVNENLPWVIEKFGGDTRKVYADIYIDDKALFGAFTWN